MSRLIYVAAGRAAAAAIAAAPHLTGPARRPPLHVMVASCARELIVDALKRSNGNLSAAGRALGVSPRMMNYNIKRYGITPEWYRQNAD